MNHEDRNEKVLSTYLDVHVLFRHSSWVDFTKKAKKKIISDDEFIGIIKELATNLLPLAKIFSLIKTAFIKKVVS